jgi:hypothetical protein
MFVFNPLILIYNFNFPGTHTKEEIFMGEILLLFILSFIFPDIAYAHGGHASGIMRLHGWWDMIRLKYWGSLTWILISILAGLIIFFIIQQIRAKGRNSSSPA